MTVPHADPIPAQDWEFYETPQAFSHWLFRALDVRGRVFEALRRLRHEQGYVVKGFVPPTPEMERFWEKRR